MGCLLDIDVMYGSLFVETASECIGEYGYKQWHDFDSIEQLKVWIKENTEIPN